LVFLHRVKTKHSILIKHSIGLYRSMSHSKQITRYLNQTIVIIIIISYFFHNIPIVNIIISFFS